MVCGRCQLRVTGGRKNAARLREIVLCRAPRAGVRRGRSRHRLRGAGSGDRRAPTTPYVLQDLRLPDADGVEVCSRLRTMGCGSPVLMLTARDGVADRVGGLDAGADDYMTKPFEFDELFARPACADATWHLRPAPPTCTSATSHLDPAAAHRPPG